jgi:hypothetical protein
LIISPIQKQSKLGNKEISASVLRKRQRGARFACLQSATAAFKRTNTQQKNNTVVLFMRYSEWAWHSNQKHKEET